MRCTHLLLGFLAATGVASAADDKLDLNTLELKINKEPAYVAKPHYALVVFGPNAEHRSWLVMDGDDILYFDRNGNGDLTDAEDRIGLDLVRTKKIRMGEPSSCSGMNIFPIGEVFGSPLEFRFWVRKKDYVHPEEFHRKLQEERAANDWENGTLTQLRGNKLKAQCGTLLTASPADAQVTPFDGPLTFAPKWKDKQLLEAWPKSSVLDFHVGTPARPAKGCSHTPFVSLSEWDFPRDVHPQVTLEYPPRRPGEEARTETRKLTQRCCGDTVYEQLHVPADVGQGRVKVTVSYAAWIGAFVEPLTLEIPINAGRSRHSEMSIVLFEGSGQPVELREVAKILRSAGLHASYEQSEESSMIRIVTPTAPGKGDRLIGIKFEESPDISDVAARLGGQHDPPIDLGPCNVQFVIGFSDLDQVLAEKSTLETVEKILGELTSGAIYHTWDKTLTGPTVFPRENSP